MASRKKSRMQWYRIDLHLHTPASADYRDTVAGYVDILRKAEQRGIDIIAFTDHNTVGGYGAMMREIDRLTYLQEIGRAQADEMRVLAEYRRLLDKILVLPGFEFTATLGFHVLGIFSPDTSIRELEYLLMNLNIPSDVLDRGTSEVGASADVLTAYQMITQAGGICIAAHANNTHGVAMRGVDFGGQTRIAYTQDKHLHALEVTDLGRRDRRSTQRFFDGTKPEYPRRMRCIQGSDAHSLMTVRDKNNRVVTFGVGERATEVLLRERSFEALLEMFQSNDFSRSRPYNPNRQPDDFIESAREEGASIIQSFHETMERKGGKLYNIIADVCAFANTNGGTIYVGVSGDKKRKIKGITGDVKGEIALLESEINTLINPTIDVEIDAQETQGKAVIRLQVPYGEKRPYAIDNNKIYIRDEAETTLAVRDEIVNLVRQGLVFRREIGVGVPAGFESDSSESALPTSSDGESEETQDATIPRAGVEIVNAEERNGILYYTMRDLRNGNVVHNVTMKSARRLWHYAIKQHESNPVKPEKIQWHGDLGLWRRYKKNGVTRYDLVQRKGEEIRVYYGVTDNGMHDEWQKFLAPEDSNGN